MRGRLALGMILVMATAGCGGEEGGGGSAVVVSAASSLQEAFDSYAEGFGPDVRPSYAGSGELAAQIRAGARPDVYAAAETDLPRELHRDGLVERPVVFAANRLVIAVPAESEIETLEDLSRPGTDLVLGAEGVPAGDYAREVLGRLPASLREGILGNVRSEEPEVVAVVGKLVQGAADAGFVYATDVRAAGGDLRAVQLPAELQPDVAYSAAVVEGAANPGGARRFIAGLVEGSGAAALREAGFLPPP